MPGVLNKIAASTIYLRVHWNGCVSCHLQGSVDRVLCGAWRNEITISVLSLVWVATSVSLSLLPPVRVNMSLVWVAVVEEVWQIQVEATLDRRSL